MKIRIIIVLATVAVVAAMIVEWKFAAFMGSSRAKHEYNGILGRGVGQPYQDFIHQLRMMAESGDTNRLVTVLRRADERSGDIDEVWLGGGYSSYQNDFYRKSIDEILK